MVLGILVIIQMILIGLTQGQNPVVWAGFFVCLGCFLVVLNRRG